MDGMFNRSCQTIKLFQNLWHKFIYFKIYGTNLSISKFMAQILTGNNRKLIQVAGQLSRKDAGYCMARHAIRGNYCMAVDQLDCKILITTK